jgi:hypothetical protein
MTFTIPTPILSFPYQPLYNPDIYHRTIPPKPISFARRQHDTKYEPPQSSSATSEEKYSFTRSRYPRKRVPNNFFIPRIESTGRTAERTFLHFNFLHQTNRKLSCTWRRQRAARLKIKTRLEILEDCRRKEKIPGGFHHERGLRERNDGSVVGGQIRHHLQFRLSVLHRASDPDHCV